LLATLLSVGALDYFFIEPRYSFWIQTTVDDWMGLGFFALVGAVISGLSEALHRSRRRIVASERRYAVTLSSIGDAVLATDNHARVTFLNPVHSGGAPHHLGLDAKGLWRETGVGGGGHRAAV
jgi:K+-sensing histidine kinase KdpD